MIRREAEGGWLLINQHDHALLSYCLMNHWDGNRFYLPCNFGEVAFAIREHDWGWKAWDRKPKVNPRDGYPMSFTEIDPESQATIWRRSIFAHRDTHPYASVLIALHFFVFNERNLAKDPENHHSLCLKREICSLVEEILKISLDTLELDELPQHVKYDLKLLQIGDALSLAICHGWREYRLQDAPCLCAHSSCQLTIGSNDGLNFYVDPFPFKEPVLRFKVQARRVAKRVFQHDKELARALQCSHVEALNFTVERL
ncbi:MAG: DUF3891 family protein [Candidatus Caldarchaeum sp.]